MAVSLYSLNLNISERNAARASFSRYAITQIERRFLNEVPETGLVVSLAVLFYVACSSSRRQQTSNANQPVRRNRQTQIRPQRLRLRLNEFKRAGSATARLRCRRAIQRRCLKPTKCAGVDAAGCSMAKGALSGDGRQRQGKGVPDFTDAAWQKKATDAEMIETIKNGHKPDARLQRQVERRSDQSARRLHPLVRKASSLIRSQVV